MKLYNFPWGPYPRRLSYYLAEKGINDVELLEVEFPHQPELWPAGFLLNLNPAHSLPVLELADAKIGQSIAILEYLEEHYPNPNLLGESAEARAFTREMIAIFDEATSFFGLWARQGSLVTVGRHELDSTAASFGAERYAAKLRVAEIKLAGPFLCGDSVTMADCVAMALLEFTGQFYGVPIPADCPRLAKWFENFSRRASADRPDYPPDMLKIAYGLPDQSKIFI